MKHRNLWLGTAFVGLLIGSSVSAGAQQYYYPYKQSDKPAVEVDMGVLDTPDAPAAAAPAPAEHTRVAGYSYVRSPSMEGTPDDQSVVVPPADAPVAPVAVPPAQPVVAAPAAPEPVTPPPEKKKKPKAAQKPPKNKPSLVVTDEPSPSFITKPAAPAANGPIISMPPVAPEAALTAPAYHDMQAGAPIISNPPDSGARPVTSGTMPDMQSLAPVAPAPVQEPIPAPAPVVAAPAPVAAPAAAPPVAAAPAPTPTPSPAYESLFKPTPESAPAPAPAPSVAPAEPAVTTTAPETPPAQAGGSAPLPEITVIHGADYPQDSEPPPAAEPKIPREEPLPLPKSHKPGHTTAQMLAPVAPAPAPQPAVTPAPMEPVASVPAPAAMPAPAEAPADASMPVVPAIADLTLGFSGNSSDLTAEAQKKLDAIIRQMNETVDGRLQVRGYATGEDGSKSSARRVALSRALMVRSYLMDKGVKPTRVDVRALGTDTERSPLDRVDLIFVR